MLSCYRETISFLCHKATLTLYSPNPTASPSRWSKKGWTHNYGNDFHRPCFLKNVMVRCLLNVSEMTWASPVTQHKESTCSAGDTGDMGSIPGLEDPLKEEMATHSSILAWKIPWTERPGRLQSVGVKDLDTTEHLLASYKVEKSWVRFWRHLDIVRRWRWEKEGGGEPPCLWNRTLAPLLGVHVSTAIPIWTCKVYFCHLWH